jgi:predicted membrane channel-forming protein YqfA (hemolysin III family)
MWVRNADRWVEIVSQDHAMRGFLIHLGIFVVVVGALATLNLYWNSDHIWFIWVLAGWSSGLAAHDLALLLRRPGRREAIFTDERKRGFLIHLFVYLAVNALLIVVNLLTRPHYYWFLIPLVGWGLLLATHAYATFYRRRGGGRSASRTGAKI